MSQVYSQVSPLVSPQVQSLVPTNQWDFLNDPRLTAVYSPWDLYGSGGNTVGLRQGYNQYNVTAAQYFDLGNYSALPQYITTYHEKLFNQSPNALAGSDLTHWQGQSTAYMPVAGTKAGTSFYYQGLGKSVKFAGSGQYTGMHMEVKGTKSRLGIDFGDNFTQLLVIAKHGNTNDPYNSEPCVAGLHHPHGSSPSSDDDFSGCVLENAYHRWEAQDRFTNSHGTYSATSSYGHIPTNTDFKVVATSHAVSSPTSGLNLRSPRKIYINGNLDATNSSSVSTFFNNGTNPPTHTDGTFTFYSVGAQTGRSSGNNNRGSFYLKAILLFQGILTDEEIMDASTRLVPLLPTM